MGISPRLDYAINPNNTLVARYQYNRHELDNQGIGDFNLPSKALRPAQHGEFAASHRDGGAEPALHQRDRASSSCARDSQSTGDNTMPAINVQGAFNGGGAQIGNSGTLRTAWSSPTTPPTRARRTPSSGADALRQSYLDSTSVSNFGGTYSFLGGSGPVLDANNQPVAGTSDADHRARSAIAAR